MALRGRDTTVSLSTGFFQQVLEGSDVVSFTWGNRQEVKSYRFFGASTDVHEEKYRDTVVRLTLNHRSPAVVQFMVNMAARGRQETSGMVVKISTKYKFPNGETMKIAFNDIKFEDTAMNSEDRESNVNTPLVGYCRLAEPMTSIV